MTEPLDDELRRLHSDLHSAAADSSDPRAALAELHSGARTGRFEVRRRHDRRAVVGAALLIAASLVAVALLGDNGRRTTDNGGTPSSGTPAPTTATPDTVAPTAPSTTAPSTTLSPFAGYDIGAISFTAPGFGWMVTVERATQTMSLRRTTDGGANWEPVPTVGLPATARPYVVTFADQRNGWLSGDGWWATHDGGATWHALPADDSGNTPNQVVVSGGYAYALRAAGNAAATGAFVFKLLRSPVGVDDFVDTGLSWEKGAGGNDVTLSLASAGDTVFVSFNDRGGRTARIVGTTPDPTWVPFGAGRGGNIDFATAPGGDTVYLSTETGEWGGDATPQLIVTESNAGGKNFSPLTLPAELTAGPTPLRFCGLRAPQPGTVVILGCDAKGTHLIASADDGQSWLPTATLPPDAFDIQLFGSNLILYRRSGTSTLMVSGDGGLTWQQSFPPELKVILP